MLHWLAATGTDSAREVWWCYAARNGREHPFAAEVRALLNSLPRSHAFVAYSNPEDADRQGQNYDASGHLNLSLLQRLQIPKEADFYLCGPTAFLSDFTAELKSWGIPASSIHFEIFGSESSITPGIASTTSVPPHPPSSAGTGPMVSFTRSGLTVPWSSQYGSLLEFAEACDVPVRWSCRTGVCHMCESGLIDGQIGYAPEPLDPPAEGNVLICCSSPLTAVELDL
jgi:ferredoxin